MGCMVGSFHPSEIDNASPVTAQPVRPPSPLSHHNSHTHQHQHVVQAHAVQHMTPAGVPRMAQRPVVMASPVPEPTRALDVNKYYSNATLATPVQQCACPSCDCSANGICTDSCAGSCCSGRETTARWESPGGSYTYASPSSAFKAPSSGAPRINQYDYKNIQHVACCCLPPLSPLLPSVVPPSAPLLPTPNIQPSSGTKQETILPSIAGLMESLSRPPTQETSKDSFPPFFLSPAPPHLPPSSTDSPDFRADSSFKSLPSPFTPGRSASLSDILTLEPKLFSFKPHTRGVI